MMHEAGILELDRKGLRDFGLTTGGIVAVLFGLFFPWLLDISFPLWPWIVFGVLGIWALAAPDSLKPVYRWWMRFGLLLNRITTPIILGAVFFLMLAPMALAMRIFGRDPMARKLDADTKSYRVMSKKQPKENMEKPF
jgi:hypothetical protein